MTTLTLPPPASGDAPRVIDPGHTTADRTFFWTARGFGAVVLIIFGAIGVFLGYQSIPTLRHYGLHFFTEASWQPELNKIGLSAILLGTVEVAFIALVVSFPLALLTALYISEYAPGWAKAWLVALIDLMAAVPSIIYGLWGFFLLQPHAAEVARWLNQNFGFIPIFRVNTDPNAAVWAQSRYYASAFIAGLVVAMMVLPMACSVMRGVFAQAPIGEREGAYALGGTRWGMIRAVVLPFGRGGIIGGTMLGLGRALGETIAVAIIISPANVIKFRPLENGTNTVAAHIANTFGEATNVQLSALLCAGFVLFLLTLVVNMIAAIIVNRSRSGAATEI